ncbi:MAG: hypothetical protein E7225_07735 [Clostridiales bacterium]|nr:hypothetical protein [Clostridiales bacterium]
MKKAGRILSLVLLLVMLASTFAFAESLELEGTYPKDGYKSAAIDNFGIKLYFNQDVSAKENREFNDLCFSVKSADGEKVPLIVVYSEDEEGLVLVLADVTSEDYNIKENTVYTLTIDEAFTASNGETLGKDTKIELTTLNQSRTSMVNTVLMMVMFGSIMIFSRRQTEKKEEVKEIEETVNPYKVAKATGKSVTQVVEEDKKNKAKQAAKQAKKEAKENKYLEKYAVEEFVEEELKDPYHQKVKGPRPISAGGSTYITGRKAAYEKARQKGTTNPKKGKSGAKKKK